MHHVVLEKWSRGESWLHRRDARAKILATLAFLVTVATAQRHLPLLAVACFVLLCAGLMGARVPLAAVLARAGIVLVFTGAFACFSWLAGDPARAVALLLKSYLSALAVLLLVSTTPLSVLLHGLKRLAVPAFLLVVTQFLWRYLFVVSEEAQHMRKAAASRGGTGGKMGRGLRFQAAGGALAALFARSYSRAEEIHRAMLARGFAGEFRTLEAPPFRAADAAFMLAAVGAPVALRIAIERIA